MSAYTDDPQTRVEAILQNILGKNNLLQPPQTRVEELLLLILNQGLGGVTYKGVTTTELTDGSTTNPIIIDGNEVEAQTGDFVAYDGKEFVWNGEAWQELGDLELVVAVMSSIAPQYISTETYNTGDRVYQDNVLYECDDNNVTGEFNPLKWHQVTITQILAEIEDNIQSIFGMISDTYDPDETYNIGRLVIHNKKLYKCNTDGTTGAWNSAKWDETSIAYELENATPVEANPAEDATAELNKIKIYDDVYSVGNAHFRPIKQVDYDALSESEQKNGTIYFIYDAPALEVTANPDDDPEQPLVKLSIDGVIYYVPAELPEVTPEDDGKILKVVDGAWVAAEEVDPTSIIDDSDTDVDTVWSSSKTDSEIIRTLSGLTDTEITSPTDKQILRYDNTSSKWINSDETSVTKTATGNPIELTDAAAAPLVKCTTEIQGSQDLHGYDKPWVGGAGKNKLSEIESGGYDANGNKTVNSARLRSADFIPIENNETYIFSCDTSLTLQYNFQIRDENFVTISDGFSNSRSVTNNVGGSYITVVLRKSDNTSISPSDISNPQFEKGSSSTEYEPYSNICPITAYTEGEIEVRGEGNMWDEEWESGSYGNGQKTTDANKIRCKNPIPCYPSTTYYFAAPSNANMQFLKADGTYISSWGAANTTFTTPSTARYIVFNMYNAYGTVYNNDISINSPSTITEYKAYNGVKHTTTYPSAIYRGSEDVVNGSAESEWALDDMGDYTWTKDAQNRFVYIGLTNKIRKTTLTEPLAHAICSTYQVITPVQSATQNDGIAVDTAGNVFVYDSTRVNMSAAEFKTAIAGQGFAYELATPTTSSVTPTNLPIRTLSGYNHIESSTGDMEIEYITQPEQPIIDLINSAVELPPVTSSDNGKVLTVVNGSWDKSLAPHIYSTTEQVIGKWVDGSDLYEKILQFTSTSSADTLTSVAHSIANVDVIYVEKAFVVGATYTQEMAPVGGLTGNDWFQGAVNSTSFDYQVGNDFVSCPVYVILRYTKSA